MADPPAARDAGAADERGSTVGVPRWVKVFGIVALVVVVLFVVLMLVQGGHGPSRHTSGSDARSPIAKLGSAG